MLAATQLATACGGKVETTSDVATSIAGGEAPTACTPPSSVLDTAENCALYCGYLGCIGCAPSEVACEKACQDGYAKAGAIKQTCLQCAVDYAGSVPKSAFCLQPASDGVDAGFVLTVNLSECGGVCGP
jgi:hypothetical protein